MGLLDELREQAGKIRAEEEAQREVGRAAEDYYRDSLQPVMLKAYQYFNELIDHLNTVKPDIAPRYPLNPSQPEGTTLQQSEYRFDFDDPQQPRKLDIVCHCTLPGPVEFELRGKQLVDRQSALLDSYRFFYHRKDRRNERLEVVAATFILEGPLRSHLRIVADPDDRAVHVMLRNLEATPTRSYRFEPGQLDPAMLERMARLMLRQERTLVQVEVSESVRRQLQARLAEEATARAAEIEQARREDDEAGEDSGAGIKGRVRRVLATGRDGLGRGKRK